MFDLNAYIHRLTRANRLAQQHEFTPCTCSGIDYLEELLDSMRRARAFVCVTDVADGEVFQQGGAWWHRRLCTVFILHRFRPDVKGDYEAKMNLCRELFRQFMTAHLRDESDLQQQSAFLNVEMVRVREMGGSFLNGMTGLYYMLSMDEPYNLCFASEQWDNTKS